MTSTNSGLNVSYGFDVLDRVTNIVWKNASSNVVKSFAYQYNNASMITNIALEDGSSLAYTYDDLDRLTSETTVTRPGWQGSTTSTVSYAWDDVGNRLAKTNGGTTVSYQYSNGCNRLTGWSATSTNGFTNAVNLAVAGQFDEDHRVECLARIISGERFDRLSAGNKRRDTVSERHELLCMSRCRSA